jgi:hypothetical protein
MTKNAYNILAVNPFEYLPFGRLRRRWNET